MKQVRPVWTAAEAARPGPVLQSILLATDSFQEAARAPREDPLGGAQAGPVLGLR